MPVSLPVSFLLSVICLSISLSAFSQRKKSAILNYDTASYDGVVFLTDGTKLSGRIIFNDNEGIVTLFDGSSSRSFNAKSLLKFEFYYPPLGRYRLFYSLEYQDPKSGIDGAELFEILIELKSFIVLSRIDRIKTEARKDPWSPQNSPLLVDQRSKKITQTETIYFVNERGDFEPYLRVVQKEIQGSVLDVNEVHNKYLNSDLFEKYTGDQFSTLVEFAKENKLSFKNKEHIIIILNEFKVLTDE